MVNYAKDELLQLRRIEAQWGKALSLPTIGSYGQVNHDRENLAVSDM